MDICIRETPIYWAIVGLGAMDLILKAEKLPPTLKDSIVSYVMDRLTENPPN